MQNHDRESEGQRPRRQGNHGEQARLQQQIAWGRQITRLDATPATILALFESEGHRFEARNLATALHRVGKLGGRRLTRDPRLERLIETCAWRIREFEPQGITNIARGCAKTGFCDHRIFEAIAAVAARRITEFTSQAIANTAWACATASVTAEPLFKAIAVEVPRRIGEFNAQEMANTIWAFATANIAAERLFGAIAKEAPRRIGEFDSQAMANTAWAFAKAGVAAEPLF